MTLRPLNGLLLALCCGVVGFVGGFAVFWSSQPNRGVQGQPGPAATVVRVEGTLALDVTAAVPCLDDPCDWVIGLDGGVQLRERVTEIVEAAAIEAVKR